MAYIAADPGSYSGKIVGSGQCVAFVQAAAAVPVTSAWTQGVKVRGSVLPVGTVIATFIDGKYPSNASGNHAAVYVGQDATGIWAWDQWKGQSVHKRHMRFKTPETSDRSNNGNAFSVVE